jgi:hypothetical protein
MDDFALEVECLQAMYPEALSEPPATVILPLTGEPGISATVAFRRAARPSQPLEVEVLRSRGVASDAALLSALTSHAAACAASGEPAPLLSLAAHLASLLAAAPAPCAICLEPGELRACPCAHAFHGACLARHVHGAAARLLAAPARAGADAAAGARAAEARAAREGAARAAADAAASASAAAAREAALRGALASAEAAASGGGGGGGGAPAGVAAAAARGGGKGAARAAAAAKAAGEEAAALRAELEGAAASTLRLRAREDELRQRAAAAAAAADASGGGGGGGGEGGDPLAAHVAAVHGADGHPVPLEIPCPTCRAPLPPAFLRGAYDVAAARAAAARAAEGAGGGGVEATALDAATGAYVAQLKREFRALWARQEARGALISAPAP